MLNKKLYAKKYSHISYIPKTLIILLILILVFAYLKTIITGYIIVFLFIVCIFINRITITSKGIKYKRKFFEWNKIKTIGVAVTKDGIPCKMYKKRLYISLVKYDKPVHIVSERRYYYDNYYNNKNDNIELETEQDYLIVVSFNRRLIHHIIVYWGTNIKNLDTTPGWDFYVRWHNFIHRGKRR